MKHSPVTSAFKVVNDNPGVVPVVTITNPANGVEFNEGEQVVLSAEATDADGQVVEVEFSVNGQVIATDITAPYQTTWTAGAAGDYNLTVKATDDSALSGFSAVDFTVKGASTGCTVTAWSATTVYNGGDQVSYQGKVYQARWWSQGDDPAGSSDPWYVWEYKSDC